jgi:hypothetical protein
VKGKESAHLESQASNRNSSSPSNHAHTQI